MTNFIFNNCIPNNRNLEEYASALHDTILAYNQLCKKYDICVVAADNQDYLEIAPTVTLKQCILSIKDKTERTYAFRLFNKYPIRNYFNEKITVKFNILVDKRNMDASTLALAHNSNGMLFTLGLCDDLRKNSLKLIGDRISYEVDNLYGVEANTIYIDNVLASINESNKSLIEKIKDKIGGTVEIRDSFIADFNSITLPKQESILEKIKYAAKSSMLNPIKADEKTIRDVTPDNGNKGPIYELRIFSPCVLRVYFTQKEKKTILIDIGDKNDQNRDIHRAYNRL